MQEILERCKDLKVFEKRTVSDEYAELVFCNEDMEKLNKILTDVLGPAIKPKDMQPTDEHLQLTEDYGGGRANQTLFKKERDGALVIAMLWPWSDEEHTTLKVARRIIA